MPYSGAELLTLAFEIEVPGRYILKISNLNQTMIYNYDEMIKSVTHLIYERKQTKSTYFNFHFIYCLKGLVGILFINKRILITKIMMKKRLFSFILIFQICSDCWI